MLNLDANHLFYDRRNIHFHELLSECEMILPEPKFPPRDPVLEARCQKLKAQQQAMEYKRMTSNVDGRIQGLHKHSDGDSFSQQSKNKEKCNIRKIYCTIKVSNIETYLISLLLF